MKIESNFLCLQLLSICTFSVGLTLATRRSFGEECDQFHKCDKAAWLSCRDGKCDCSKSDEMLYDQDMRKCMTKSGERCKYGADSEESVLVEITDCVPNSICGADGVCQCESKYHEIYNGTCGLSLLFGGNCSEEDQCSKFAGLHCVDLKCKCKDGVFSEEKGLCVGRSQSDCVRNECVDGAICVEGKCLCDSEHFHSTDKTCLLKKTISQNCYRDVECLQTDTLNLRCISNECNCQDGFEYSNVQKYEYNDYNRFRTNGGYKPFGRFTGPFVEMCAPRLDEKCPDGYCMENAFCDAKSQDSYITPISMDVCRCINNQYSPNKDFRYCAKTFGQNCFGNFECIDDLVCSAGKCNCPAPLHQFFDSSTNACLTKIGGHCTETSTCIPNSSCVYVSSDNIRGHCRCNTNFVVNNDKKCDLAYGAFCFEGLEKCDTIAGLSCINGKCSCPDTMYDYNAVSRKCLGLVGAACGKRIQCEDHSDEDCYSTRYACIKNAYCEEIESLHECVCMDGHTETDNFKCMSDSEIKSQHAKITDNFGDRSGEKDSTEAQEINYDGDNCKMHKCDNGQCIRKEWYCDGIVHCDDNSDENDCPEIGEVTIEYENGVYDVNYWTCRDRSYISRSEFCNGYQNCNDGSDEPEGCQETAECGYRFKCFSGGCVERVLLCNGKNDCDDGSDEEICSM